MNMMLRTIIQITNDKVQEWKTVYGGEREMSLSKEVSDLVAEAEFASVFGVERVKDTLKYREGGVTKEITVGPFLK